MYCHGLVIFVLVARVAVAQSPAVRERTFEDNVYESGGTIPNYHRVPSEKRAPVETDHSAGSFTVLNTNNSGAGSLSQAIVDANNNPGFDSIKFSIGSGAAVIAQPMDLPSITSPVIIDGRSQPGYSGAPLITIDGWGVSTLGLYLAPGSTGSTIRGIVVSHFAGNGVTVNANNTVIEACYIGTTPDGSQKNSNTGCGIFVQDASYCRIGGTSFFQRNVISGNGQIGVIFRGNAIYDTLQGNYIGTDAAGTHAVGNSWEGARCNIYGPTGYGASYCLIGGTTPGARNIISGNDSGGVYLIGTTVNNNRVIGNYIGTDVTGTQRLKNGSDGVRFFGSTYGTASYNTIGGSTAAERNIISANGRNGVAIEGGTYIGSFNKIIGNYIGTDLSGTINLGNGQNGVYLTTAPYGGTIADTRIGGASSDSGNVISGNTFSGIYLQGINVTRTSIIGNKIGLSTSSIPDTIPNLGEGIKIEGAEKTIVGGASQAAANLIGGNHGSGILVLGSFSFPPAICGNLIGTDQARTAHLGNYSDGICVTAWNVTVGGQTRDSGNVVAFNGYGGVSVLSGTGNRIRHNAIFSNKNHPGIDLGRNGLTINDSSDGDTGANGYQNFPLLDSVITSATNTKVYGRMDSAKSNTTLTIDIYEAHAVDILHFGGADSLVGSTTVTTDIHGNTPSFSVTIPRVVPPSHVFSATATDPGGNTSEFSQALSGDSDGDGIPDSWETQNWGIDVNSDGVIDYNLYDHGARPYHKDIFVEVDAMTDLAPDLVTLGMVEQAFARVPDSLLHNPDGFDGINLLTFLDETNITREPWFSSAQAATKFAALKKDHFGSSTERVNRFIIAAKKLVFRYCIFAEKFHAKLYSGRALRYGIGLGCTDFMITLGGWTPDGGTAMQKAGTFMHELGHTLGLGHGGADEIEYKPNYISVMNYTWQDPYRWAPPGTWDLRYSTCALPILDEARLNERSGLNPPPGSYTVMPVPFRDGTGKVHWATLKPGTSTDWNGNGDSSSATSVSVDISRLDPRNPASPDQPLNGFVDWRNLAYNFRTNSSFTTSLQLSPLDTVVEEMTPAIFDFLDSLPPPKPASHFTMDGQLDPSATLLTSNSNINLYIATNGPQLYVATNSAQSQTADMFIFVAVVPGAPQDAPWLKNGEVAGWTAVLGNRSSDNFREWSNGSGQSLFAISADTAGSVLEGVIDLEYLTGVSPPAVYLAVGKYQTENGGILLAQVPVGNSDANIDANEFIALETALPIQLASFTAHPLTGGRIHVEWTTISEINNYGFEVQRKRESELQFIAVPNSFTSGHGTTNEPHHYSFVDSTVTHGNWRYRLKQIDLDGTVSYGPEAVVELLTGVDEQSIPTAFALHQNYPNPFNPVTTIRFDLPVAGHVTLKLFNVLGQEVATLRNETLEAGYHRIDFNAGFLSSGVYFYTIKTDGCVSTKKMILTK